MKEQQEWIIGKRRKTFNLPLFTIPIVFHEQWLITLSFYPPPKKKKEIFTCFLFFFFFKKCLGWKSSFLGKSSSLFWLDWWMVWDDCATNVWTCATKRLYIKWGMKIPNFPKIIGRILIESVNKCMNCSSFKY